MVSRNVWIAVVAFLLGAFTLWAVPRVLHRDASDVKERGSVVAHADADDEKGEKGRKEEGEKKGEQEEEEGEHKEGASPVHVSHDEQGYAVLNVPEETEEKTGIVVAVVAEAEQHAMIKAYGRLELDPAAVFTLRAPVAGFLMPPDKGGWPRLGDSLDLGTVVGLLRPRLSTVEQCDLTTRLAQARSSIEEIKADLAAARSSYESKRQLNQGEKVVSVRALEEAEAKVKSGEAQLDGAMKVVEVLEKALTSGKEPMGSVSLSIPVNGEIIDLPLRPGETVEAGQVIVQAAELRRLVARVTVPAGEAPPKQPRAARVTVAGREDQPVVGDFVVEAPTVSAEIQGRTYLIGLTLPDRSVRPGTAASAYLETEEAALHGVIVPRSAVIRYGGGAWVYVDAGEHSYRRVPIKTDMPLESGWFVARELKPHDVVIVTGAGSLLSDELRSQIEQEAAGEE